MKAKISFSGYLDWLKDHWLKVGIMVGAFYVFVLVSLSSRLDMLTFTLFLAMPLYVIHEIEEYILPGGFSDFFNERIFKVNPKDQIQPLDREVIFWINIFYVYIFLPLGGALYMILPSLGAWVPYYFLFHSIGHPILSLKGRRKYNGGMFTSIFLFIPYACFLIYLFMQEGILNHPFLNWQMAVGVGLNLLLPVIVFIPLPFGILTRYKRRAA